MTSPDLFLHSTAILTGFPAARPSRLPDLGPATPCHTDHPDQASFPPRAGRHSSRFATKGLNRADLSPGAGEGTTNDYFMNDTGLLAIALAKRGQDGRRT